MGRINTNPPRGVYRSQNNTSSLNSAQNYLDAYVRDIDKVYIMSKSVEVKKDGIIQVLNLQYLATLGTELGIDHNKYNDKFKAILKDLYTEYSARIKEKNKEINSSEEQKEKAIKDVINSKEDALVLEDNKKIPTSAINSYGTDKGEKIKK